MGYPADLERIDLVFTGLPGPAIASLVEAAIEATKDDGKNDLVEAVRAAVKGGCEFVEAEDMSRRSIRAGQWIRRDDGCAVLRLEVNAHNIEGRQGNTAGPAAVICTCTHRAYVHVGNAGACEIPSCSCKRLVADAVADG